MKTLNNLLSRGHYVNGKLLNNANKNFISTQSTFVDGYPIKIMDPISSLPNIVDSFVEVTEYNELLGAHKITKRQPSVTHILIGNNKVYNHYLAYVTYKLNVLLEHKKYDEFWKFALLVMKRSSVFKAVMLHEVKPHWHREMNMKELYLLMNKYNIMCELLPKELKHHRVYLPKVIDPSTGLVTKYRPLGVPTLTWRLYLHTWNYFLMIFLHKVIPNYQHGFYHSRGTKTAWEQVLLEGINAKNIYEFDLEQFFPSVNSSQLTWQLKAHGVPNHIANYLFDMNLSYPRISSLDESKMTETNALHKAELDSLGLLHNNPGGKPTMPNLAKSTTVNLAEVDHHDPSQSYGIEPENWRHSDKKVKNNLA